MPRTTLFPNEDIPVTIKQGQTGDCYLLASLDCILNVNPEGRQKVKSMFTETEHGVTVRIKRTSHSVYLQPDKLKSKYDHHYDAVRDEDVFVISNERLDQIDCPSDGVTTNSLAVKIIERLSAYYYVQDWGSSDLLTSVLAHNVSNRHEGTSTAFVGNLLGVHSDDNLNLDELIKLKALRPEQPVYLSMSYGRPDAFGRYHGRHGLRVVSIIANPGIVGGYDVVLANPWDNQKTETYSLDDISKRTPRFCAFDANPQVYQLTRLLLDCSDDVGQYVIANPELHDMLVDAKRHQPLNIERYVDMHKQMESLPAFYNALDEANRKKLIVCFNTANGANNGC